MLIVLVGLEVATIDALFLELPSSLLRANRWLVCVNGMDRLDALMAQWAQSTVIIACHFTSWTAGAQRAVQDILEIEQRPSEGIALLYEAAAAGVAQGIEYDIAILVQPDDHTRELAERLADPAARPELH